MYSESESENESESESESEIQISCFFDKYDMNRNNLFVLILILCISKII